ncbi:hypothetical protein J3A83DRAFT_2898319 [Scleroderma citrinum]
MAGTGLNQRPRTKASDLTDLFRSTHGSRHASKNVAAEPGASTSSHPDKSANKSRRSMLPFLGRKKSAEQPITVPPRKSTAGMPPVAPPSNTVRRSLGNGPVAHTRQSDTGSERTIPLDHLSSDEYTRNRNRAASHSGSDTDASRAYDSSPRVSRIKQPAILRSSSIKQPSSYQSTVGKVPGGHPPPCPLPSPPLTASSQASMLPTISSVNNTGIRSRQSGVPQRPRASTLSSATLLGSRSTSLQPGPSTSTTYQKAFASENKIALGIPPDASPEELREALSLQRKKYAQLQEYIITITKRYEDDRVGLTKTVEKLERDIRKKTREIEGLRWLVIHHGAVEDIDAAASLARSSLSTHDESDRPDTDRESSSTPRRYLPPLASHGSAQSSSGPTTGVQTGLRVYSNHTRQSSATLEVVPSLENVSAASSQTSLTLTTLQASVKSLSAIPERPPQDSPQYDISRAERQQAKEERRAARALRRVSGSSGSSLSSGANLLMHSSADASRKRT